MDPFKEQERDYNDSQKPFLLDVLLPICDLDQILIVEWSRNDIKVVCRDVPKNILLSNKNLITPHELIVVQFPVVNSNFEWAEYKIKVSSLLQCQILI
jgi:hypothetical protein